MKTRLSAVIMLALALTLALVLAVKAQGTVNWIQVNPDGFDNSQNIGVLSLAPFGGQLYAGTYNIDQGAQLWRTSNGSNWTPMMSGGFGSVSNAGIDDLLEFNGQLYASTAVDMKPGGEVWRSSNGLNWTRVISQGFGDPKNIEVFRLATFNNTLFASTWVSDTTHGTEIWSTDTGNTVDWTRVVSNGFNDDVNNQVVLSFESYNDYLYASTRNTVTGAEVWRTNNGTTWAQVNPDGFGSANNNNVSSLASFNGYLYAGTSGASDVTGAQVWRCQICDGSDWMPVLNNGLNVTFRHLNALETFAGQLYFVVGNGSTGMQVWRTATGTAWEQVGFNGFGDSGNKGPYWDNSVIVFDNRLYIGTYNPATGGEVWSSPYNLFLPLTIR